MNIENIDVSELDTADFVDMILEEMEDMADKPWVDEEDMANHARFARCTLAKGTRGGRSA